MNADDSTDRFSPDNLLYDGATEVVKAEEKHIEAWRGRKPQVGLALSGGGIRSASYCLGVLQALAYKRALPHVDYLSTVSGGGYIGASLTYLLHQSASDKKAGEPDALPTFDVSKENFPYVSYPMVGVGGTLSNQAAPQGGEPAKARIGEKERLKGRLLRRLRQSSNYLVPGDGITFLSLAGVVLRNLATSVVVHAALLVVLFQLCFSFGIFRLNPDLGKTTAPPGVSPNPLSTDPPFVFPQSNALLVAAALALGIYAVFSVVYVLLTRLFDSMEKQQALGPYSMRRYYEVSTHWLFVFAIAMLVVGGLPWVHELLVRYDLMSPGKWLALFGKSDKTNPAATGVIATIVGVVGNIWGFLQARSSKKPLVPTGLVVGVASALLFFGLLLLVYILTRSLNVSLAGSVDSTIFVVALLVIFWIGWWPEANYVSLHRFYRDRLLELFMPDLEALQKSVMAGTAYVPLHRLFLSRLRARVYTRIGKSIPGNATLLGNLCGGNPLCASPREPVNKLMRGPYHIINANIALGASQHPRYRARGGDNFILSPLFCGSRATNWVPTDASSASGFTLATAMAISGAALNPNAGPGGEGITRQPVLSVLMGMLNLRLGYWASNPKWTPPVDALKKRTHWVKPNLLYPGLFESFGRFNLNEYARFSLLTDGGHFENLGIYELVRRRLKLIVVCDATADPDFKFTDLANAIHKVRADFGAIIDIDTEKMATLMPQPVGDANKDRIGQAAASQAYLIAPIRYSLPVGQPDTEREIGTLILLKATAFKGLRLDLHSYRREHPEFPNQSTGDQFFDEKQLDVYRELGYETAYRMLRDLRASAPVRMDAYETRKGYEVPSDYSIAHLLFGR